MPSVYERLPIRSLRPGALREALKGLGTAHRPTCPCKPVSVEGPRMEPSMMESFYGSQHLSVSSWAEVWAAQGLHVTHTTVCACPGDVGGAVSSYSVTSTQRTRKMRLLAGRLEQCEGGDRYCACCRRKSHGCGWKSDPSHLPRMCCQTDPGHFPRTCLTVCLGLTCTDLLPCPNLHR